MPPVAASGLTLVEMLVALGLALALALAAISLLVSTRATFTAQDDNARLVETGLYALAIIERAVRQAGLENWDADQGALVHTPGMAPAILGLDDARLPDMPAALQSAVKPGINRSDVLALKFFGSGNSGGAGDGRTLNCAGVAVAEPGAGNLDAGRGWSIFHVARTGKAEPELRCKYRARNGHSWTSEAIAPGVESMQVLYGIDRDGDGLPQQFFNADQLDSLTMLAEYAGTARNPWNDVVEVRVALLVRGENAHAESTVEQVFDFFGQQYSTLRKDTDHGVQLHEADLPLAERKRLRRLFSLSIPLRNQPRQAIHGMAT